jgi:signal peptide peptidase-like protein 2B
MYAPEKPSFDGAIPFLWLMAVGSVACASVWSFVVVGDEVYQSIHKKYVSEV